jgi:hypothetical protein
VLIKPGETIWTGDGRKLERPGTSNAIANGRTDYNILELMFRINELAKSNFPTCTTTPGSRPRSAPAGGRSASSPRGQPSARRASPLEAPF